MSTPEPHRRGAILSPDRLLQDVRYALRTLRSTPGFTFTAVAILALGIGANTAIFSLVSSTLLRPLPLPFPEPERLVMVWDDFRPTGGPPRGEPTLADFVDWRDASGSFDVLSDREACGRPTEAHQTRRAARTYGTDAYDRATAVPQ